MDEWRRSLGQLLVVGFPGKSMSPTLGQALQRQERGGVILFRRNLTSLQQTEALTRELRASSDFPLLIGIDEEGGRVRRLPAPALKLPPMRVLGDLQDTRFTERVGRIMGAQLRALGINLDFAPVLDVLTHPKNEVIGDRAFGTGPLQVTDAAYALARGLQGAGVAACGKHFPGHGATQADSHLELPTYSRSRTAFDTVDARPFAHAGSQQLASLMTAHVLYPCVDARMPATLSPLICTRLLRHRLGFEGVLFSDDLEMKALAPYGAIEQTAECALRAGCDALLVCSDEASQESVLTHLCEVAQRDDSFAARCEEASRRCARLRHAFALPAQRASWTDIREEIERVHTALQERMARPLDQPSAS